MTHPTVADSSGARSAAQLRVTFWGVQGSCPIFPTRDEVDEYARRIATTTIERTLANIAERLERGELTPAMIRKIATPQEAAEFQRQLGMPALPIYGGDTTCIEVVTDEGQTLVFDMGTGLRDFSKHAMTHWEGRRDRTIHVFASHEHLDHRSGLPFASVCFERENPFTINVYGTRQFLIALDERYGIYSHQLTPGMHVDDPLDYRVISAKFTGTEIRTETAAPRAPVEQINFPTHPAGEPISIGSTMITPFEVYHGSTQCLAYKVRHKNATFIFCTDHELRHGEDPADLRQARSLAAEGRLVEQCRNADVMYIDGQYFLDEYLGREGIGSSPGMRRIDWGHGCIEDIVARVRACNIRRAFIGHHDPERLWGDRVELDRYLRRLCEGESFHIELAKAGDIVEI